MTSPLAHTKIHMLDLIEQLHQFCSSKIPKIVPENPSISFSLTIFSDMKLTILLKNPSPLKLMVQKFRTPTSKLNKCDSSKFINKLHMSLKLFYFLLHDSISFEWTPDLDKLFIEIETSISKDAKLIILIPNTTHPFYITVEASLMGWGAILFQPNNMGKMQVISFYSRI